MSGTAPFPSGEWVDLNGKSFNAEMTRDHVTLIALIPCDNVNETTVLLKELYNQFLETEKANFLILDSCNTQSFRDSLKLNWFVYTCPDSVSLCRLLIPDWPQGKHYALVDRDNTIRSYYAAGSMDEKRILLEHMALLLPRERSEKVELKRGNRK